MRLEGRPDAGGQGLRRGALGCAAHGQALGGQGACGGGADGCELQRREGLSAPAAPGDEVRKAHWRSCPLGPARRVRADKGQCSPMGPSKCLPLCGHHGLPTSPADPAGQHKALSVGTTPWRSLEASRPWAGLGNSEQSVGWWLGPWEVGQSDQGPGTRGLLPPPGTLPPPPTPRPRCAGTGVLKGERLPSHSEASSADVCPLVGSPPASSGPATPAQPGCEDLQSPRAVPGGGARPSH